MSVAVMPEPQSPEEEGATTPARRTMSSTLSSTVSSSLTSSAKYLAATAATFRPGGPRSLETFRAIWRPTPPSAEGVVQPAKTMAVYLTLVRAFCTGTRIVPEIPPTRLEMYSARRIQARFRRWRFYRATGETIIERWHYTVEAAVEERRRERKEYIAVQKKAIDRMMRVRSGGNLRPDWSNLKKPPGGVAAADPRLPLARQIIWTNHDVGLFVAVAWSVGIPPTGVASFNPFVASKMQPFYDELCPPFRKKDVRRMLATLKSQGAIEDMKFLKYLHDKELDRLVPAWLADDVRKLR